MPPTRRRRRSTRASTLFLVDGFNVLATSYAGAGVSFPAEPFSGEDFALYLDRVPGTYTFLGVRAMAGWIAERADGRARGSGRTPISNPDASG
ncbi:MULTISPECIES: hypothetical protein [unclassified Streptomyces]|uniref:hypothetical protein n=1 Tax=unclassified Streptomyces TaxID=2593676 RepID=UPI002035C147|nr:MULTISPECIES: hypothetical protein [unclassified Streptomyces]